MSWRVIWIPELLGAVLGGIFVFRLGMGTMPKTVLHACEEVTGMLRENRRYENWVTGTEKKLRKGLLLGILVGIAWGLDGVLMGRLGLNSIFTDSAYAFSKGISEKSFLYLNCYPSSRQ